MRIRLTAYKQMAHTFAIRIDTKNEPDFRRLMAVYVSDANDSEFDDLVAKLTAFWDTSRYEYPAIYFWVEDDV